MTEIGKFQGLLPTVCTNNRGTHLRGLLDEQLQCEQVLWRQKSRESWLVQKDLNTMFFYTSTIIIRSRKYYFKPQEQC